MSNPEHPPKPVPTPEEIQAYLDASAARTKKRLPLAKAPIADAAASPSATAAVTSAAPRPLPLAGVKDKK